MENYDKKVAMQNSSVFGSREHVDFQRVFWNGSFLAFK